MIYQFIPNAPVRVMERLIRSMAAGSIAILDLEDGISMCGIWSVATSGIEIF